MIRIAITGPECSGKTTLSMLLASHYNLDVIPEFARSYLGLKAGNYEAIDLDIIAQEQVNLWNEYSTPLVCDTELTVLKIWSEVKYKRTSPIIQKLYEEQRFDYYFLCFPDIPWEPDPLREHPEERVSLFEFYKKEINLFNRPFSVIRGNPDERLKQCVEIINTVFPFFKK
jgi:nicotinamide riboside kinase